MLPATRPDSEDGREMGILSRLMGNAETTARGGRTGRSAGRPASTGRRGMRTGRTRRTSGGRGGTAASGGLSKLLGSLKRR